MKHAKAKVIGIMVALLFLYPSVFFGEEPKIDPKGVEWDKPKTDTIPRPDLKNIKCFLFFWVIIDENSKKLGLKEEALEDFLKLQYKNNFANFPAGHGCINKPPLFPPHELGVIRLAIDCVGKDYPIAFSVDIKIEPPDALTYCYLYEGGTLGICEKKDLEEFVKKAITLLVQEFAIKFFKARGEL